MEGKTQTINKRLCNEYIHKIEQFESKIKDLEQRLQESKKKIQDLEQRLREYEKRYNNNKLDIYLDSYYSGYYHRSY